MKADILSVGTELLLGEVTDTNSAYLAFHLRSVGIGLEQISTVGDELARLVEVLQGCMLRSDLIVTTGGLGPTQDDMTREAIAKLLGEELRVVPEIEAKIRSMFAAMGRDMPSGNIKQATLVPSARRIPNPRGTAPGWWVEKEGKHVIALPGPPGEMRRMWEVEVMPEIRRRFGTKDAVHVRSLKCYGVSEAEVDQMVSPLFVSANPTVGIYAKPDGIHVHIIERAYESAGAEKTAEEAERKVRRVLGDRIWGSDEDTLEEVVGRVLMRLGLSIATMESCTGGLLGSTLTDVAGSSAYYRGGLISYTNEVKESFGVTPQLLEEHGAVSREVSVAMAEAARRRFGADMGIGITGVAGPESLEGKPPGLAYIGIVDRFGSESSEGSYPPRRDEVKRRAVTHALFLLRKRLTAWDEAV